VEAHRHDLKKNAESENAVTFQTISMHSHPKYKPTNFQYDFSVWKVKKISGAFPTQKLRLDTGALSRPGTPLTAIGWGQTTTGKTGKPSPILLQLGIKSIDEKTCGSTYKKVRGATGFDPNSHMCAGKGANSGVCFGDSGGPLFSSNNGRDITLVGIVSHGNGEKCGSGAPDIYTRISAPSITNFLKQFM
jgi:secreted trypsin-like serine protease